MILVLVFVYVFSQGCASIPKEAPELSAELGKRISVLEEANITLLNRYFNLKRENVDKFIVEEWVPTFAQNFFSTPNMQTLWEKIVTENNKQDRLDFILHTAPKLQAKINSKRLELIKPLDDLERLIEQRIRSEYTQARSINNSITSFLYSASKVDENRTKYLNMFGISDTTLTKVINETDKAVNSLITKTSDVEDKIAKGKEFISKIEHLKDKLIK